jgi:hypothetical protein
MEWRCIPESALEQIATLQSLRQLSLSADDTSNMGNPWVIDHRIMRSYLGKLQSLRKIAFDRDCYDGKSESTVPTSDTDEEETAEDAKPQTRLTRTFQIQPEVDHGNVGISDVCYWKRTVIVACYQNCNGCT